MYVCIIIIINRNSSKQQLVIILRIYISSSGCTQRQESQQACLDSVAFEALDVLCTGWVDDVIIVKMYNTGVV